MLGPLPPEQWRAYFEAAARYVLTDSGGVQEETSALGIRCFTLRNQTEREVTVLLADFATVWNELFPAEQARIVQLLVERIEIAEDGLDIRFRTDGLAGLVREFGVDARAAA